MTRPSPDAVPVAGGQPLAATPVVCTGIDGAPEDRAAHALTTPVPCTRVGERPSTIPTGSRRPVQSLPRGGLTAVDATLLESLRRELRAEFPAEPSIQYQALTDRVRRSLSWMSQSLALPAGTPPRFVNMWIALNSLYGQRHYEGRRSDRRELDDFETFTALLLRLGGGADMQHAIRRIQRNLRGLASNPFLWNDHWRGERTYRPRSREAAADVEAAAREGNVRFVLHQVFARLLVLRNQVIHGSAAADTLGNRGAVVPALRVLETLLPIFAQIMIRRGRATVWPPLPYPRVDTPLHPWHRGCRRSGHEAG